MATATKKRSPFQSTDGTDFGAVYGLRKSDPTTGPEEKSSYLNREYTEYANPERTIVVVRDYNSYEVLLKTSTAVADVVEADAELLTSEEEYYVSLRGRGVYFPVLDGIKAKTRARSAAEALLALVQDVNDPLAVSLDGRFAPALTIALKDVEAERDYWRDDKRVRAVQKIAEEAGVSPILLALAIKENRLVWSTPPVAPKQVMVVVREDATGVLTERLVDEIVLASDQVEGLGRIVHEGSVTEYLLKRRERLQRSSVTEIVRLREETREALQAVANRSASLQADLDKGQVIGRGFHDTLRLAEDVEKAQSKASAYAAAIADADLPEAFLISLARGEFVGDSTSRWERTQARKAMEALAALNGMPLRDSDGYY